MPGTIDLLMAGFVTIVYPIWDTFILWPRMLRSMASGRPNARVPVYREIIALEWIGTALIAAVWTYAARPWHVIGLVAPAGWRLVVTIALVLALVLLWRAQVRAIRRMEPARLDRARIRNAAVSHLVARTPLERAWFVPVAVTAGVCEEFVYRGFLVWVFRPWLGLWGAALASTITFGFAHAYQGRRGAVRAGIVGALFAGLAITLGSIVPGMVLHALLDLIGGESSYALFAEDSSRCVVV